MIKLNLIYIPFTESNWYQAALTYAPSVPVGVCWHDTAAGNPTLRRYVQCSTDDPNKAYFNQILNGTPYDRDRTTNHHNQRGQTSSVNAYIGKLADGSIATIQVSPFDFHPWGAGGLYGLGSVNGYYNYKSSSGHEYVCGQHFQFEICDDGYVDNSYFEAVYKEAVEFTAYICRIFNFDPFGYVNFNNAQYNGHYVPVITCHKEANYYSLASDHSDVYEWFRSMGLPRNMDGVRQDVYRLLHPPVNGFTSLDVPSWYDYDEQTQNFNSTVVPDLQKLKSQFTTVFPMQSINVNKAESGNTELIKTILVDVPVSGKITKMIFADYGTKSSSEQPLTLNRVVYKIMDIFDDQSTGKETARIAVSAVFTRNASVQTSGDFYVNLLVYYIQGTPDDPFPTTTTSKIFLANQIRV